METTCLGDVRDIHVRLGDKEAAGFADPEQIGMGEQGDSRVFRKKTADAVGRHVHGSGNLLQSERRTEMSGKIIRQFRELLMPILFGADRWRHFPVFSRFMKMSEKLAYSFRESSSRRENARKSTRRLQVIA